MNEALFRSMQEQMRPSAEARDALMEKLASAKKKTVPAGRYVAIAACAAVIIAAVPVYGMVRDHLKWQSILAHFSTSDNCYVDTEVTKPHSYVMSDEAACWPEDSLATGNTVDAGTGDQDQNMTPGELTDNMREAGFSQEDVAGYLASGWQMTWAKWWKFYHQAEESGEWTLEALLDFSREEKLTVNTGEADVPGGTYVGGAPDQSEAIMAYQNLMARFEKDYGPDHYPEWYGGAYIDDHGGLIVNIEATYEPDDKELYFQIWKWAGSEQVGFGTSGSGLSLNQLKKLQDNVEATMEELGLQYGCGIDEEAGQVELTLPEATMNSLWALARLDPADTAVRVVVGQMAAADDLTEEPMMAAPSVSNSIQPGGGNDLPGMIVDADGAIAYEPQG